MEGEGEEEHPAPPAPAPKAPVPVRQPVIVKDGMARIPGGRFTMGSDDKKAPPNERPARVVFVPPFWIDRTEVTVGAYRACVERGACPRPVRSSASCTYDMGDPMLPVSCVPWTSAQAYCIAMNKRLPREVEWELAARGTSPIKYPWGGTSAVGCGHAVTLASDSSQRSCGRNRPARVGTHPGNASPFGVLDMSGNVEEWVADWYGETVSDLSPRAGASHVLRGGGWLSRPSESKTTSRNWGSAREAGPNVGFRCARDD
jgi:serine/threonine-protein kinase